MHGIQEVVESGKCVGCGACAVVSGGNISMGRTATKVPVAILSRATQESMRAGSRVCPFSDASRNEDSLGDEMFGSLNRHDGIGRFDEIFAGRVSDQAYLRNSSSGGMTSWVAGELLKQGEVDGVVHVTRNPDHSGPLFTYSISHDENRLEGNRKSDYYAASFAEVVGELRSSGGSYAFVGVPCFVRALRTLCDEDPELRNVFKYMLGLVCGHLKSPGFAESLAWQAGVHPSELDEIDFRVKNDDRPANRYDYGVRAKGAASLVTRSTSSTLGGNWGHGMFQLNACNYCDDVFAETADATFGDAWLPQYSRLSSGTNVVVTRNPRITRIISDGIESGQLNLDGLTPDQAVQSQSGNFRHRRDGLRVRLADDLANGLAIPKKRVQPGYDGVTEQRVSLIRQRRRMGRLSEEWFAQAMARGSVRVFVRGMRREVLRYQRIEGRSWPSRVKFFLSQTSVGEAIKRRTR